MMLTVERAALVAALTQATKAVETRNTVPILANVLLSADEGRLTVRATDLDIEITTSIAAQGELAPTTTPARTLLDIAKRMPAGAEIKLLLDDGILTVSHGRSRFKLATLSASDYPELSQPTYPVGIEVDLATLVAPVAFAMSDEETRYYLNGVFLHTSDGRLRAVATDGHRLAAVFGPPVELPEGIIVPRKAVAMLPEGQITVDIGPGRIRFTAGSTTIVSKLVEGSFPDYERVIPKDNNRPVTLDRALLAAAVERVGVFASERAGKTIRWDVAPGGVTLTAQGEGGQANDEVAADYEGEPFAGGFNADYVVAQLRAVGGDRVTFNFSDGGPVLVTGGNPDWTSVLMPQRVA